MFVSYIKLYLIISIIVAFSAVYFFLLIDSGLRDREFILTVNKTIAFSGVLCIVGSLSISIMRRFGLIVRQSFNFYIKHLGLIGFYLSGIHILISLLKLNKENHPYLFDIDLQLNLGGQMTILFGALSFGIFLLPVITSISSVRKGMSKEKWQSIQSLSYFGIAAVSFHLLFIIYERYNFAMESHSIYYYEPLALIFAILIILFFRIIAVYNSKSKRN